MTDLLAYMIGPKAENYQLFRELIVDALDDHAFWRRNFFPQDRPVVSAFDQSSEEFRDFADRLRDRLFEFLSEAKKGIPFFSPRYIGHMNTDLLLPALVGYFGAMLYNQNNVAGESSPVTMKLEREVIDMMATMIGFKPDEAFGYLCGGGTAANFYALWVARNVRTLPLSLRLALLPGSKRPSPEKLLEALRGLSIERHQDAKWAAMLDVVVRTLDEGLEAETARGELKRFSALTGRELMNLPVPVCCSLRSRASALAAAELGLPEPVTATLFDEFVGPQKISTLGEYAFRHRAAEAFPQLAAVLGNPWALFVARNKHYSWVKAADVLGLGREAIVEVDHLDGFDVDVTSLERELTSRCKEGKDERWPLAVVSLLGSTEEGALDELPRVYALHQKLARDSGTSVWWHVDAAYGGYLPTMFRRNLDDTEPVAIGSMEKQGTLKYWLAECCRGVGMRDDNLINELIEMSEGGRGTWLKWDEVRSRSMCLSQADSVALDPHKLGYIPYPAGAVFMRCGKARELVSCHAPYLWADDSDPDLFTGRFTLEGSRPGATAAACWLAHSVVPLDQSGHGRLVALSILATRRLYRELQRLGGAPREHRVVAVHQPHTNMFCYVPYHPDMDPKTLCDLTKSVLRRFTPTNEVRPFMAVETTVEVRSGSPALREFDPNEGLSHLLQGTGFHKVDVVRSVVMGPFGLTAVTRTESRATPVPLYEEYVKMLGTVIGDAYERLDVELLHKKADSWTRHVNFMLMDDDPTVGEELGALLAEVRHEKISRTWQVFDTEQTALARVRDYNTPLDVVFLDIDMRGSSAEPRGTDVSGYTVFEAVLARNEQVPKPSHRVQLVVFFSRGRLDHPARVSEIQQRHPGASVRVERLDKEAIGAPTAGGARQHVAQVVRGLLRQIAGLDVESEEPGPV